MPVLSRSLAAAVSLVVGLALALPASAGPATDTLRRHIDRIFSALADPQLKGVANAARRQRLLRAYAEEALDFREAARRALGPHWEARTPDERARFVQLFTDLIDQAYLSRLSYNGERVVYDTETVSGGEAIVLARALGSRGTGTPVQFQMVRDGAGQWRVYDVAFEGMSLVGSYRAQFNKIIRGSSFAELVSRLEAKIRTDAQASTGDTPASAP
jgi:phospholipid transport system substrate-binding protein